MFKVKKFEALSLFFNLESSKNVIFKKKSQGHSDVCAQV